ncbi:High-affinity glucose transporter [Psilocybe cubensis]|uniref:High-affinity glucose transporter n=1 Tax=Psilocybe cubensis TaxID=181762 RepID=A0ACB8H4G5_PSICU|nr:High-affinity glucose transporter [Psilocybe cubensis]KAH9482075.1 High-affinity glucose transporter [Psilocybe cubensis]
MTLQRSSYTVRYPRWMVGKRLLYSSSALASLGDAMFGYSQGIIAAAQVQPSFIRRMYGKDVTLEQVQAGVEGVDEFVQAIVVACLNLTALVASLAAAYICDILGRRMSIRIGGIIYLIASIIQIFMPNLATLIVGRCIQGLGVGMLSMTVPIYQCEIAPGHGRGLFVSIEYFCLNSGYALSAWVGYGFFFDMPSELSWRGPYIIQAILAVILVIWTFFLPESPRWLIKNDFKKEGFAAIADLHANGDLYDPLVGESYAAIEGAILLEDSMGQATWGQLFTQYTRRTIVGITCQLFAQFNGINAILYFLPENLTRAGFDIGQSLLYSGACALVYCAGTIPTMFFVDTWGRKSFLLFGSAGLVGSLALIGGLQFYVETLPLGNARISTADGIFAGEWGPVPWLLGAEVFPLRARAKGMALSTGVNWISNFVVAFITPPLFATLKAGYYFLLLGFSAISGIFVWLVYRETAGKTLEQLGEVFGDRDVTVKITNKEAARRAVGGEAGDSTGDGGGILGRGVVAEPLEIPGSTSTIELEGTSEVTLADPNDVKGEKQPAKEES